MCENNGFKKMCVLFEKKHIFNRDISVHEILKLYPRIPTLITRFEAIQEYKDYDLIKIENLCFYHCVSKEKVNLLFFNTRTKRIQKRFEKIVLVFVKIGNEKYSPIHINRIVFEDEWKDFKKTIQ